MTGFKSFAERTKLLFEPGLIAIVGPNGCGKSNVSDAIRWVLGEQRPTALRGSKMLDVIFNGTDARPPMNMAEVSITFAECDNVLETEFNEITITRRVFRSGEGAYFINKTPCRLRDISRLFMGTGIGINSYSVMAQGQIDAILSSRPEDRRAIFEEAAGITKFKADRKEALRKLEQTEANLLRLTDVIREVKRQIGSLQRQAARARRYREIKDEARGLDIFVTRCHIARMDSRQRELDAALSDLTGQGVRGQGLVAVTETATADTRASIMENERHISEAGEAAARDAGEYAHAGEVIKINTQRIAEYRGWMERDAREAGEARKQGAAMQERLATLAAETRSGGQELEAARARSLALKERVAGERQAVDAMRRDLQSRRDTSMARERRVAQLQNQTTAMDARQRAASIQHERLLSEHSQLEQTHAARDKQANELAASLAKLRQKMEADAAALAALEAERQGGAESLRRAQEEIAGLNSQRAARLAQIDLLKEQESRAESFQGGARLLLDAKNPLKLEEGVVLGPLAGKFNAAPEYRPALEAVLRAWIDAVVLRDSADVPAVMRSLMGHGKPAAARMVAAAGDAAGAPVTVTPPAGMPRLVDRIEVTGDFSGAAAAILGNVFIAATLDDIPAAIPAGATIVTLKGAVFHADGFRELWMAGGQTASPLARRLAISDGRGQVAEIDGRIAELKSRLDGLAARQGMLQEAIAAARRTLDESRRQAAQCDGEWQSVVRDVKRAAERLAVVAQELKLTGVQEERAAAERQTVAGELQGLLDGRASLTDEIESLQKALQEREASYNVTNQEYSEARIRESSLAQRVAHLTEQSGIYEARVAELRRQCEGRNEGMAGYGESIRQLTGQNEATQAQMEPMRLRAEASQRRLVELRKLRDEKGRELAQAEEKLSKERQALETLRERHGALEIELAETRVRRQNLLDRMHADYQLTLAQLLAERDPSWNGAAPTPEEAEERLAKLNSDIQEMGPVNLVAIDEYKEHEERYALLKAQEEDLLKSKEQVLDLLRMINKKTAEMFNSTFEQANANFEQMFTKLFNGGTAKLVQLDNREDPLECGIEVIARPPGKRLQSISLLSGGERTMTAVSLLFAIYMIKPSPFCLLDELDAALDDSNIGRFVQALKDFLVQSQFLIITHNQHTIANSGIVYGVTMPEKGVSKILSMRLPAIGVRDLGIGDDGDQADNASAGQAAENEPAAAETAKGSI